MRHPIITRSAILALAFAATAGQARVLNVNTDTCKQDYSTTYNVDLTAAGLAYHRKDATPARFVAMRLASVA